ncbi:hypothetical protein [Neoroseomonas soli]|uniref:Uncharacterized protein n=1 Tax=Neoroseomonas soli TaxID=1081025 RepID=A0A9X9X276_9PROT|nr:hypothetical protein [Neoroseomonas soli]MBR0673505.1 hypothetical protein [Neoroseomonas soli]
MIPPPVPLAAPEMALWRAAFERRPDLPERDVPLLLLAVKLAARIEASADPSPEETSDFHAVWMMLRLTPLAIELERRAFALRTGDAAEAMPFTMPASVTRH